MTRALRILVVEDEMLVSMLVEDMLSDMGHIPVGPANRLATGLAMAEAEELDLGILDVNLGGGDLSFGIADILTRQLRTRWSLPPGTELAVLRNSMPTRP